MINIFRRKRVEKPDVQPWTKNLLLTQIVNELREFQVSRENDTLVFHADKYDLVLSFIKNNYSDTKEIELNASISFAVNQKHIYWGDLFHVTRDLYNPKQRHRSLNIRKDEEWSGSYFKKELDSFIKPFLFMMTDRRKCQAFLTGEAVTVGETSLRLPKHDDMLRLTSQEILNNF